MSNYTKLTDFAAKDTLPSGNAGKIVKGSEIDDEFNSIEANMATKANIASPTFTGTPKSTTPANNDNSTRIATTNYTVSYVTATLTSYYTKTQVDDLQPKWGDSRKFVQTATPTDPQEGDFWFKV